MSINAHGHRAWGKNSHVSEKVVTTRTHIVRSSYAVHVAVMRRDTVVTRKIFAACSLFLRRNGTIHRVCQVLSAEIHCTTLLLSIELVETPPIEHYNDIMQKYWRNLIWRIAHESTNPPNFPAIQYYATMDNRALYYPAMMQLN